jgi:hypothetical protein
LGIGKPLGLCPAAFLCAGQKVVLSEFFRLSVIMSKTLTYSGLLSRHSHGEADDILFLSTEEEPLAEVLDGRQIRNQQVTVRYWITDKPCSREEAIEDHARQVIGLAATEFRAVYSETTGYLWTYEKCKIGGHDLIEELKDSAGKWLILEIEVH